MTRKRVVTIEPLTEDRKVVTCWTRKACDDCAAPVWNPDAGVNYCLPCIARRAQGKPLTYTYDERLEM